MKVKNKYPKELNELCKTVKQLSVTRDYDKCIEMICELMCVYPDAPHLHNLLGLMHEFKGNHVTAMNHFRAAWALDATYLPARLNLETYGTFLSRGACAFDESDVKKYAKTRKVTSLI